MNHCSRPFLKANDLPFKHNLILLRLFQSILIMKKYTNLYFNQIKKIVRSENN